MAAMGEATFHVKIDPSRVLDVIQAMDMMARLLDDYGHTWTEAERATIAKATDACESRNLTVESA